MRNDFNENIRKYIKKCIKCYEQKTKIEFFAYFSFLTLSTKKKEEKRRKKKKKKNKYFVNIL